MKAKETKEEVSLNQHIEDLKERMKMLRKFFLLVVLFSCDLLLLIIYTYFMFHVYFTKIIYRK